MINEEVKVNYMYSEENKASNLAKFLSNYDYVFVDTCSLMEDGFPPFMDTLVASKEYWKDGLHVIVPEECVNELKKHKRNKEKNEARIGAIRALKILRHDQWHGKTIEIEKNITDGNFGDQAITQKVVGLRIKYKILVITQDKTLTNDLLKLNNLDSQRGHYLEVYKIMADGELTKNLGDSGGYSRPIENKEKQHRSFSLKTIFKRNKEPKKKKKDEKHAINVLLSFDKKLAAHLGNQNYPFDKKLADINAQLALLSVQNAQTKSELPLLYSEDRLLEEKAKMIQNRIAKVEEKKETKKTPIAVKKDEQNAKAGEATMKNDNLEQLLRFALNGEGVLVRDDSVPYLPLAHGPADVTERSLRDILKSLSSLKDDEEKTISFGDLIFVIAKHGNSFSLVKHEKIVQKAVKKEENDKTKSLVTKKSKQNLNESGQKKEKKETMLKTKENKSQDKISKRKENETKISVSSPTELIVSKDGTSALPSGVNLIVGEPSGHHFYKKAIHSLKKESGAKKEQEKSKKEILAKMNKEKSPKSAHQEKAKKDTRTAGDSKLLKQAMSLELRLNANMNNPTYPLANKVRDIDSQIKLIQRLSKEERSKLKLSHEDLLKKKRELKK